MVTTNCDKCGVRISRNPVANISLPQFNILIRDNYMTGWQSVDLCSIGVMVACRSDRFSEFENPTPLSRGNDWRLEIIQNASLKYRKRSIAEMLFCMLRSGK